MIDKTTFTSVILAVAFVLLPGVLVADTFQVQGTTTDAHFIRNSNGHDMGSILNFTGNQASLALTQGSFGPQYVSSSYTELQNTVSLAHLTVNLPDVPGGNVVLDDIYTVLLSVDFTLPNPISPDPVSANGLLKGQLRHDPANGRLDLSFDPGNIDFTYGPGNSGSFTLLLNELYVAPGSIQETTYDITATFTNIHAPTAFDAGDASVPEPGSIALLGTIVAGLFWIRKSRSSVGA